MPEYRNTGIPAKNINYLYGNMKDASTLYFYTHLHEASLIRLMMSDSVNV
jgi:hypothetical protein